MDDKMNEVIDRAHIASMDSIIDPAKEERDKIVNFLKDRSDMLEAFNNTAPTRFSRTLRRIIDAIEKCAHHH